MIYLGEFKDINDSLYTVRIITNGDSTSTTKVVLAETPVTTEIESDSHIYKPCKYSSSTIRILTNDYHFDLYSSKAQQNKVELIDYEGTVKWVGYLTPNLYNMGYESVEEEIELEAIDGLSTLQYIKFSPISGNKSVVSFLDLINYILGKCNCYTRFYVSKEVQKGQFYEPLLDKLVISEQNFYDEDGEPMTLQEVLEEICQYLGFTCIAKGNEVLFLDYDAIKKGMNNYYQYTIGNITTPSTVTLEQTKSIGGDDYTSNGATLSLDNVYNKVIVKDSLYAFEEIIPSLFNKDNIVNITASSDAELSTSTSVKNGAYGQVIGNNGNYTIAFIDKVYNEQKDKYKATCAVGVQYYRNDNYTLYDYTYSIHNTYSYTNTVGLKGAVLAKFFVQKLNKSDSDITKDMENILNGGTTLEKYLAANEISKFDYQDYLVLINPQDGHISNDDAASYPYFSTNVSNASALFGGSNAYILISGTMLFNSTRMGNETYPVPEDCIDPSEGRYHYKSDTMYLLAKLKWGNKYWDGSKWTTTDTTFQIPFSTETKNPRVDATLLKEHQIMNTVTWATGTDKKGYCIKCPSDNIMSGLPELTVYKPMDFMVSETEYIPNFYPTSVMFLKNFSIEAFIGDPTFNDDKETDTEYTNIIDDEYVEELGEIECKICTWDNKAPNYSAVGYKEGSSIYYIDSIYNKATGQYLRAEEHIIYRLVNQYSTPSVKLNLSLTNDINVYAKLTDKWLEGKEFIVDGAEIDWAMNKCQVNLIEKK